MFELKKSFDPTTQTLKVYISGEIDLHAAPSFKAMLYDAVGEGMDNVELNCSELSYVDSTGLGILLGALKKVRLNGRDVVVCNLKENIRKLFRITGLDRAFRLEDSE